MSSNQQTITDLTDEREFEQVFRTYYSPLCHYANKYTEDLDVAEEIVQDVFTSIWSKANEVRIQVSIKSYLYGAVRNAAFNYLKHQKIKKAHETYVLHRGEDEQSDLMELEELQDRIRQAMDQLPAKCREIFELCRFEEMKYKEVADQLGISIKTVENQMGKALKIMRNELGSYLPALLLLACELMLFNQFTWGYMLT